MRLFKRLMLIGMFLIFGLFALAIKPGAGLAKTLEVGAIVNLEWPLGIYMKKFLESYVPYLNEKGGLDVGGEKFQIKMVIYNSKGTSEGGRAAAERLVYRDGVKFILGDETVEAWLPVTESNKVLTIATAPTEGILSPKYKYCFQGSVLQTQAVVLWGWFTTKFPEVKSLVTVYPDDVAGRAEDYKAQTFASAFSLEKAKPIFYMPGTTDFSAIATKVIRSKPDVFSTAAGGPVQDSLLIKALHEGGFKGIIFTQSTVPLADIARVIPLEMAEGMISAVCGIHLDPPATPLAKDFKNAYIAKYQNWDEPDSLFFDPWFILAAGLAQAKSTDPVKVAAFISNGMKFDAMSGPAMMVSHPELGNNRTVDVLYTAYIRKITSGKAILIDQVDLKKGYELCKQYYGWK